MPKFKVTVERNETKTFTAEFIVEAEDQDAAETEALEQAIDHAEWTGAFDGYNNPCEINDSIADVEEL